jgi:exodeoxyribonuclease VII large subunit
MASLPPSAPLTVTEINRRSRLLLENQIGLVWVVGEISRATLAPSGHWYFVLKDEGAAIDCAMFKGRAQYLDFRPENGLKVEVRARVTIYEPRGAYQLAVEQMRHAGLGALFEAFEKLKARLGAEGLFEAARKKPLPAFARAIGVVTSPAAAALRDILTTLARRAPMVPVILYPTPVQGDGAAVQIARAIETANARRECDVLVVARGGGSLEDLWAFNEEAVARAIAASAIPVVSGVGHETDFTIADFVADLRAATPTAAAVAASPDRDALLAQLARARARLARGATRALDEAGQRLDLAARRLLTPAERIGRARGELSAMTRRLALQARQALDLRAAALRGIAPRLRAASPALPGLRQDLDRLALRLAAGAARTQRERRAALAALAASLGHLDPAQVLRRGYAIVRTEGGGLVRSGAALRRGDALEVTFAEGGARVTVEEPRADSSPDRPGV